MLAGGQGGTWVGSGGGAGGIVPKASQLINAGTYPIVIGNGAPRATANGPGVKGENSNFNGFTAKGGGGGGSYPTGAGVNGGSGGGEAYNASLGVPGEPEPGQGYRGGYGWENRSSGAGGGASHVGGDSYGDVGSLGGDGIEWPIGSGNWYAGGGGGWGAWVAEDASLGGKGGGGRASDTTAHQAGDGVPNTGGGGGVAGMPTMDIMAEGADRGLL